MDALNKLGFIDGYGLCWSIRLEQLRSGRPLTTGGRNGQERKSPQKGKTTTLRANAEQSGVGHRAC